MEEIEENPSRPEEKRRREKDKDMRFSWSYMNLFRLDGNKIRQRRGIGGYRRSLENKKSKAKHTFIEKINEYIAKGYKTISEV